MGEGFENVKDQKKVFLLHFNDKFQFKIIVKPFHFWKGFICLKNVKQKMVLRWQQPVLLLMAHQNFL